MFINNVSHSEKYFETLPYDVDCSPFDSGSYHPESVCCFKIKGIQSFTKKGQYLVPPIWMSALPPNLIQIQRST